MSDTGRGPDAPGDSGSIEHVGPAQPIDPARRRPKPTAEPTDDGGERAPSRDDAAADAAPTREDPAPESTGAERRPVTRPGRRLRAPSVVGAVDRVRKVDFPVVLRGYDRAAVDAYVAEVAQLVAELEATQLPESVVQRALDEVGDETSEILKLAHEAAEEVAARSRWEAAARLERAEREAEVIGREADEQVRALDDDAQAIWQERQRLIEDLRQLAEDVLALADDALERRAPPGSSADPDEVPPQEPAPGDERDEGDPATEAPFAGEDESSEQHYEDAPTVEQSPEDDRSERLPG